MTKSSEILIKFLALELSKKDMKIVIELLLEHNEEIKQQMLKIIEETTK